MSLCGLWFSSDLIQEVEDQFAREGYGKYPGWFLDTTSLRKDWAKKFDDPALNETLQEAMPMSLHLFHPKQVSGALQTHAWCTPSFVFGKHYT